MAEVVVLMMGEPRRDALAPLEAAGHDVRWVEPRFPDCKAELESRRPALLIVDGVTAPSHGRATAAWLATLGRWRVVPTLFLDVPEKDMARVKKEVPRAQFATWASALGAAERLIAGR